MKVDIGEQRELRLVLNPGVIIRLKNSIRDTKIHLGMPTPSISRKTLHAEKGWLIGMLFI